MAPYLIVLIAILSGTAALDWKSRCTEITSLTGQLTYKDRETNEIVVKTAINTNMKLGETICFKLDNMKKLEKNDSIVNALKINGTRLMYQLQLTEMKQVHPIQNFYRFAIPETKKVKCYCDCPCYADRRLHEKNFCEGAQEPCVQLFSNHETDAGCAGSFICSKSNSETLCSFSVGHSSWYREIYKAVDVGTPTTWAQFILDVYDQENGEQVGRSVKLAVDLSEGQQQHFEDRLSGIMSVAGPGERTIIPSSWYFHEDNKATLFSGIEINTFNDYNLDKLGWLRWDGAKTVFPPNLKPTLKSRFSYKYSNCGDEKLSWDFSGRFADKEFGEAAKSNIKDRYANSLSSVKASERMVEAILKTSSRMTIFLEFEETSDIIFFKDNSKLTDFSVDIKLDRFSTKFLNFSLSRSAGSLVGYLRFQKENDPQDFKFSLYVDSVNPINTAVQIGLPPWVACENSSFSVCLKSISQQTYICRNPIAYCEKLPDFVLPEWGGHNATGGNANVASSKSDITKFFEHINPVVWFKSLLKNAGDLFGWLGFISNVIILVIILVILKALWSKCGCGCLSTRKKPKYVMVE